MIVWIREIMIEEKALQMTAKWKQYSKEELQKIADKSNSAYEFYKALGYTGDPGGKGLKIAKDNQLDISHWTRHIRDQLQENEKIKIKNQIYTRDELQDICNECRSYTAFAAKLPRQILIANISPDKDGTEATSILHVLEIIQTIRKINLEHAVFMMP